MSFERKIISKWTKLNMICLSGNFCVSFPKKMPFSEVTIFDPKKIAVISYTYSERFLHCGKRLWYTRGAVTIAPSAKAKRFENFE